MTLGPGPGEGQPLPAWLLAAVWGAAGEGVQRPGITMLRAAASQQPGFWNK